MAQESEPNLLYPMVVGLAAWLVPGAGHFILGERTRAIIIFVTIAILFTAGLYIGSIGVIDSANQRPWYIGQMLTSPVVSLIARQNPSTGGMPAYPSYGKPFEIGQIYTAIAGMLNVLCIVNAIYMAYTGKQQPETD
jgi:hypothetical protein